MELFQAVLSQIDIISPSYTAGDLKRDMVTYLDGNLEYFSVSTHLVTVLCLQFIYGKDPFQQVTDDTITIHVHMLHSTGTTGD